MKNRRLKTLLGRLRNLVERRVQKEWDSWNSLIHAEPRHGSNQTLPLLLGHFLVQVQRNK